MNVPLVDLKAQYRVIRDQVRAAVDRVLESQNFILGEQVAAFEAEAAAYCGVPHAIGVASGTDALLLSLKALGVGPGDAVVTVAYTFFGTAGAIVNLGARPIFVEIDEHSFNMDPDSLATFLGRDCAFNLSSERLIHKGSNTAVKAIIPVHLYGQCADMDRIRETAGLYRIPIVEDSCQALGARFLNERAGTMGDLGCFSFFPSKNLGGAGDGGMIVTRKEELARQLRVLRAHGAETKYHHRVVGLNSRLDEIQAAILRVKLGYLDEWSKARGRTAASYEEDFGAAGLRVITPPILPNRTHIFHQYVIRCPKRDELRAFLKDRGIGTEIYYPLPLHEQDCFRGLGYNASDFPRSRAAARQSLALPIYPELTAEQREHVVACIAEFYSQNS